MLGDTEWTFQTFDDHDERKDGTLAKILHGTFDQHKETLAELNRQGAGVFVAMTARV